mgnify:CR=1 FL=1
MSNIKCNINENVSYNEIVMYYLHNDYEKRKLLIQELQVMNVQMRIITEDNIDQLTNLSYQSRNIDKLLHIDHGEDGKVERDIKEIDNVISFNVQKQQYGDELAKLYDTGVSNDLPKFYFLVKTLALRTFFQHSKNGFLCDTPEDWYNSLRALLANVALREEMGILGRQKVLSQYSVKSQKSAFLSLFN